LSGKVRRWGDWRWAAKGDMGFAKMGRKGRHPEEALSSGPLVDFRQHLLFHVPTVNVQNRHLSKALCQVTVSLLWEHWVGSPVFWFHRDMGL